MRRRVIEPEGTLYRLWVHHQYGISAEQWKQCWPRHLVSNAELIQSSLVDGRAFAVIFDRHFRAIFRFLRGDMSAGNWLRISRLRRLSWPLDVATRTTCRGRMRGRGSTGIADEPSA